jgi:hypothetical protein
MGDNVSDAEVTVKLADAAGLVLFGLSSQVDETESRLFAPRAEWGIWSNWTSRESSMSTSTATV